MIKEIIESNDEHIFYDEISDEALEAAAGYTGGGALALEPCSTMGQSSCD